MTPRNVDRYLAVLRAPTAVQGAFDCGALPLDLAARVAHLAPAAQAGIAREIEAGRPAAEVVRGHIARAGDPRKAARVADLRLLRHLDTACAELEGRADEVELKSADVAARIATLERSAALIEAVRGREEETRRQHEALVGRLEELRRHLGLDGEDRT